MFSVCGQLQPYYKVNTNMASDCEEQWHLLSFISALCSVSSNTMYSAASWFKQNLQLKTVPFEDFNSEQEFAVKDFAVILSHFIGALLYSSSNVFPQPQK